MTTSTYLATDWKLWTYQPQPGSFVLDFSQLNGTDVLGNGSDGLAVSSYDVASVNISTGGPMDSAVVHSLIPETAEITVNVKDFTTDVMNDFYVGTAVFLAVDNPSGYYNSYTWMFYGIIDSASVSVMPGSDYSTISISARAFSSNQLNTDVAITKNETSTKSTLIMAGATAAVTSVALDTSVYNYKGTARESKSLGEWLADLALCEVMQLRDTAYAYYVNQISYLYPETWQAYWAYNIRMVSTKTTGTSVGTLDENSITNIELDWSGAGAPTGVNLTNYTDSSIVYQYGSTASGAGGSVSYSATVDVKDVTQMAAIGTQLLAMVKAFRPITVTTTTATNGQTVTWKDVDVEGSIDLTVSIPAYPANLYQVGDTITIDLPNLGVDAVDMIVIGRNIEVTPDNWTTSYTLWKGFTA